uniref:3'-5' exonuclease domain-containing protein n=1 Tax=Fagus sylvatica TaxID=28930 RepID=A0A2N9G3K5_FAGSY
MGNYEIEIHGAKVEVSVVENPAVDVAAKIEELRSSLQTLQNCVVGLDIKFVKTEQNSSIAKFLLLCVGTRCLIIQVLQLDSFPETLRAFLADETICFLGTGMSNIVQELDSRVCFCNPFGTKSVKCKTGVEVGFLAAKILKKPNIEKYGFAELAGEIGMDIKQPIGECPDWNAKVFSHEEIKYAIHNAYTSYVIGNKLLGML